MVKAPQQTQKKRKMETLMKICLSTIKKNKTVIKDQVDTNQATIFASALLARYYQKNISGYGYVIFAEICPDKFVLTPAILINAHETAQQKNVRKKILLYELMPNLLEKAPQEFKDKEQDSQNYLTT